MLQNRRALYNTKCHTQSRVGRKGEAMTKRKRLRQWPPKGSYTHPAGDCTSTDQSSQGIGFASSAI